MPERRAGVPADADDAAGQQPLELLIAPAALDRDPQEPRGEERRLPAELPPPPPPPAQQPRAEPEPPPGAVHGQGEGEPGAPREAQPGQDGDGDGRHEVREAPHGPRQGDGPPPAAAAAAGAPAAPPAPAEGRRGEHEGEHAVHAADAPLGRRGLPAGGEGDSVTMVLFVFCATIADRRQRCFSRKTVRAGRRTVSEVELSHVIFLLSFYLACLPFLVSFVFLFFLIYFFTHSLQWNVR